MTSAECQIAGPKGSYLVFTLPFFQTATVKTGNLTTKTIAKKPEIVCNWSSRVSYFGKNSATPYAQIWPGAGPPRAHCL
jgi:hypothetical protein